MAAVLTAMRCSLAAVLCAAGATAPAAIAGGQPHTPALLVRSWQCSVASIQPSLSARLEETVADQADGRTRWSGSSNLAVDALPILIVHETAGEGIGSLAGDALQVRVDAASVANITQPQGMDEPQTIACGSVSLVNWRWISPGNCC